MFLEHLVNVCLEVVSFADIGRADHQGLAEAGGDVFVLQDHACVLPFVLCDGIAQCTQSLVQSFLHLHISSAADRGPLESGQLLTGSAQRRCVHAAELQLASGNHAQWELQFLVHLYRD